MDATVLIAAAGLLATTITALGVPFIQGRVSTQNAMAIKLHDERVAVFTDAMLYLRAVQDRLDETIAHPDDRQTYTWPAMPHRDLITARLQLVAPPDVLRQWDELIAAWEALTWNLEQDSSVNERGDYHVDAHQPDVVRVRRAVEGLGGALRHAAGAEAHANQPHRRLSGRH